MFVRKRAVGILMLCLILATGPITFAASSSAKSKPRRSTRSASQVNALIMSAGKTPPEWWDSVALSYPDTLELSWPDKPPGPWNARKNVGQYIWSIINENPGKWKSGVRFLHHMLTVHKDDAQKLIKVMDALASMYCNLHQDYARAAFWWHQVKRRGSLTVRATIRLAHCYFHLGSKAMAVKELSRVSNYLAVDMIKLWSDMGELKRALSLADNIARHSMMKCEAYLAAGDACRYYGRTRDAYGYYQKVLDVPAAGQRKDHYQRFHARARASMEAVRVVDALDLKKIPDGTYAAESIAYEGPLGISITIKDKRIEKLRVTRHKEKQFYASITAMPERIIANQGIKGVDAVTGATVTSEAIINATIKALVKAMNSVKRR